VICPWNKTVLKKILNIAFLPLLRKKFSEFEINATSSVSLWNVRGGKNCQLIVGSKSMVLGTLHFEKENASIIIGSRTFVGRSHVIASSNIFIGNDVLISWGVTIIDHNSHSIIYAERASDVTDWIEGYKNWENVVCEPTCVKDKVWIGFNSIILKGVTIGEGSIVGAGSVVTKDVPAWSVVAGNPARIIREISQDERS
jgi:acetyltransferase-like isoleucine patch superfamily enzyme